MPLPGHPLSHPRRCSETRPSAGESCSAPPAMSVPCPGGGFHSKTDEEMPLRFTLVA